MSIEAQLHYF